MVDVGYEKTAEEALQEIISDKVFYEESDGGVTFSGGEPMFQSEFLLKLAKRCKEEGIHTALDTSGHVNWDKFAKVLKYIDLILYDLKAVDPAIHKEYVGTDNHIIIENLKKLKNYTNEIFLRLPIVRGVNDSLDDAKKILCIIKGNDNIKQINLLEYHKMGMEKYPRIGREYELTGEEKPLEMQISQLKKIYEDSGYKVVIGG